MVREDGSRVRAVAFDSKSWPQNLSMKQQIGEDVATTLVQRRLLMCMATSRSCRELNELHKPLRGRAAALQVQGAALALTFPGHKHLRSDSSGSALCTVINTALKSWVSGCKILPFSKASFYHHFTAL